MRRPRMKRAWFLVGFPATVATAAGAACTALVPDLPTPPGGGIRDGGSDAPAADALNEVDGGDASVGASDAGEGGGAVAGDANEGSAPDASGSDAGPTFVQANSFASGGSTPSPLSATFASAQAAGDLIVAIALVWKGEVSQTPVDTMGNQYHLAKRQQNSGTRAGDIYIWYAWNCAAATANGNTVTVAVPGSTYQDLIIEEWTNVQSSADPLDVTGGSSGQTGAPSCTVSPTMAGVAIAGSVSDHGQTGAGSGWKLRVETTDTEMALDQLVSPGTIAPNTTPSDDDWTIAAAVFKAR
nr:hypothetical protein Hi04_10k_c2441B_00025 [uncultured bacterium]